MRRRVKAAQITIVDGAKPHVALRRTLLWTIGIVALISAAAVLVSRQGRASVEAPAPATLPPESEGSIRDWLLCVPQHERVFFEPTQADLVIRMRPGVRVHVHAAGRAAHSALHGRVQRGRAGGQDSIHWVTSRDTLWPWTRDVFVAGRGPGGEALAYLPAERFRKRRPEQTRDIDLGQLLQGVPHARQVPMPLVVEGGAVVADEERVFVSTRTVRQAEQDGVAAGATAVRRMLEEQWGLPVEFVEMLGTSRSEHCDIMLMPAGTRRMVVSDPRLGAELLENAPPHERARLLKGMREFGGLAPAWPGNAALRQDDEAIIERILERTRAPEMLAAHDQLVRRLRALGYTLHPVPYLCEETEAPTGLAMIVSYTNVILEVHQGRRTAYLGTCRVSSLDRVAVETWKRLGYEVVTVDALGPFLQGGGLRCLSQVFRE